MKYTFTLLLIVFGLFQNTANCGKSSTRNSDALNKPAARKTIEKVKYDRLPENIKLETKVRKDVKNGKGETVSFETTTVEKRLDELKARYEMDKLIDENGKEIRFYELLCRGASRGTEEDEQDRQAKEKEFAELEKKFTVIVLSCDAREAM